MPKIFFATSFCGKSDVTNQTSSKSSIFSWFRFLLLNSACSSTTLQQEEVCSYFFGSSVVHLLQASRQAHRRTISFNALFQINYSKSSCKLYLKSEQFFAESSIQPMNGRYAKHLSGAKISQILNHLTHLKNCHLPLFEMEDEECLFFQRHY